MVDTQKVQSIVLANSSQSEACRVELEAQNVGVLYQNELGVLFADTPADHIRLSECEATVVNNLDVPVSPRDPADSEARLGSVLQELLPANEIGALDFIKANPEYDGRGVIIGILDTGVELDHPMLRLTTTAEAKVIDFEDFSGEGKLNLEPVHLSERGTIFTPSGEYLAKSIQGKDFHFANYLGSQLNETSAAQGDHFEDVGVLTYQKGNQWVGRIDTNNNKSFDDEQELSSYFESKQFTKLGENRKLTTVLNVKDATHATLCFDDGTHGTHVAGIAAGNDPNTLTGVAPGAKIVAAKIGDNRLSGGSTTTASMILAIDHAVSRGAQIINLSYGIRAGSNQGTATIDTYIDKVAVTKNILFSISAGNEGPGLLSIGSPAAAAHAITVGAYVSKNTAHKNYNYTGVLRDHIWWFSSLGPLQGGGLKPSVIAPGTAFSSLPNYTTGFDNYRGTSMAAPEVTGGLALLLSAAQLAGQLTDRASITKSLYSSAKPLEHLSLIEQGFGLVQIPEAYETLKQLKEAPIEYRLVVNSPTSENGTGAGIYSRHPWLPDNSFRVTVVPELSQPTNFLKKFKLVASASWIKAPEIFVSNGTPRSFQVVLDESVFETAGFKSEKIEAIDEETNELAFVIPVTVISPELPTMEKTFSIERKSSIAPGEVARHFAYIPVGVDSVILTYQSDGPVVSSFVQAPDGATVSQNHPANTLPLPKQRLVLNIKKAGIYEFDLLARESNLRTAQVTLGLQLHSFTIHKDSYLSENQYALAIQNNLNTTRVTPKVVVDKFSKAEVVTISGVKKELPFLWTEEDKKLFSGVHWNIVTAKKFYDEMTDYPYQLFCPDGSVDVKGGLGLVDTIEANPSCTGDLKLVIQGAFAKEIPDPWVIQVKEIRPLQNPTILYQGTSTLLESGRTVLFPVKEVEIDSGSLDACPTLYLEDSDGKTILEKDLCDLERE